MPIKCLIVDVLHPSIHTMLTDIGVDYDYQPDITREEIIEKLSGYEGLIIRSKTRVDTELLANADKLTFVARPGAGIDNMDEHILAQKKIAIINAPEGNRDAVGEHTLGLLLNLLNNMYTGHNEVIAGKWDREGNRGEELAGKTVGIIGYGNMGKAFAQRLTGFKCKVLAYDKHMSNYGDQFAKAVQLKDMFAQADIVSLHIPLTEENFHMATIDFFNQFKKNIIFINTSRGEIAAFKDLIEAIDDGKIRKAGLDVLECENFSNLTSVQKANLERLRQSGKVLFTPHVAGWTSESYIKLNSFMVEKIQFLLADHISN